MLADEIKGKNLENLQLSKEARKELKKHAKETISQKWANIQFDYNELFTKKGQRHFRFILFSLVFSYKLLIGSIICLPNYSGQGVFWALVFSIIFGVFFLLFTIKGKLQKAFWISVLISEAIPVCYVLSKIPFYLIYLISIFASGGIESEGVEPNTEIIIWFILGLIILLVFWVYIIIRRGRDLKNLLNKCD